MPSVLQRCWKLGGTLTTHDLTHPKTQQTSFCLQKGLHGECDPYAELYLIRKRNEYGKAKQAQKEARRLGVNLLFDNPWHIGSAEDWVFGPDPIEDNIYRCLPQVNLHGMDEGLTMKLNLIILSDHL